MQRTADFHDQIADAGLPQAASVVDDATALDVVVYVLDAHAAGAIRRFAAFCVRVRARPRGFFVGMISSTRSSVKARKPRSWSNRTGMEA